VLADDSWHVRRQVNDNEIIERTLYVGEITNQKVILAAADYSMLFQASSAELGRSWWTDLARTPPPDRNAATCGPQLFHDLMKTTAGL
jgi:hypothetical protein